MLLSMTGFGEGRTESDRLVVRAEIRSVNNRYLKISIRSPDRYATLEGEMDRLVRKQVARGTIQITLRCAPVGSTHRFQINTDLVRQYRKQLDDLGSEDDLSISGNVTDYLGLPGVISEAELSGEPDEDWTLIERTLQQALTNLTRFRETEGAYMSADLQTNADGIREQLSIVEGEASERVDEYRSKLLERVNEFLEQNGVSIEPDQVIREVSLYADRSDINEEITRLRAHLEQFDRFLEEPQSQGRKLEFLGQEMFREVNTIGSKSNSVQIAHAVVEMKSCIEKMREILQNVE